MGDQRGGGRALQGCGVHMGVVARPSMCADNGRRCRNRGRTAEELPELPGAGELWGRRGGRLGRRRRRGGQAAEARGEGRCAAQADSGFEDPSPGGQVSDKTTPGRARRLLLRLFARRAGPANERAQRVEPEAARLGAAEAEDLTATPSTEAQPDDV